MTLTALTLSLLPFPQFLESAYGFTLDDSAAASQYDVPQGLLDIFVGGVGSASATPPPSAEELESRKTKAEERKTKGKDVFIYKCL